MIKCLKKITWKKWHEKIQQEAKKCVVTNMSDIHTTSKQNEEYVRVTIDPSDHNKDELKTW